MATKEERALFKSVTGDEKYPLLRGQLLISAALRFYKEGKFREARLCNGEGTAILYETVEKLKLWHHVFHHAEQIGRHLNDNTVAEISKIIENA